MPVIRKLDAVTVEQIVAWKGARQSDRWIAATLGVSHSTVSRRLRSEPELRVRIHAAKKREARRARDRERKARAKARREAGLGPGSRSEPEQRSRARPSPAGEQALGERGTQVARETARSEAARVSRTRPHGRRDELRVARRIILDLRASFEAREAARSSSCSRPRVRMAAWLTPYAMPPRRPFAMTPPALPDPRFQLGAGV